MKTPLPTRNALIEQLRKQKEPFDLIVIGGGASGAGVALDAVSRGYSVALFEAKDFGSGTSSRSTKLVHGGVRYLQQLRFSFVREALRERKLFRKNAPHLFNEIEFVLPIYKSWERFYYGAGLKFYDLLAFDDDLPSSRFLNKAKVLEKMPGISPEKLQGGISYFDGQFDDSRMAITLILSAISHGAISLNYFPVTQFIFEEEKISGVIVKNEEGAETFSVTAKAVVNCTGVHSDQLRALADKTVSSMLKLSQGTHIVIGRDLFPGSSALIVPNVGDGRVLFIIPWRDVVLIGPTESSPSSLEAPVPLEEELSFLVESASRYLKRKITRADIQASFASIRPLVQLSGRKKNTAKLSREHLVYEDSNGLFSLMGGKWTTYRKMAEDCIDKISEARGLRIFRSVTHNLPLYGATTSLSKDAHLRRYGSAIEGITQLENENSNLKKLVYEGYPFTESQVVWAVRSEYARKVEDVLFRRIGLGFMDESAATVCQGRTIELLDSESAHRTVPS